MKTLIALVLLLQGLPAFAQLAVVNNPTGAAVVVTQPSAVFITWTASSGSSDPTTVTSDLGQFVLDDETLGEVPVSLTTTVPANGTGIMTETLLVPPDVANRSFKKNAPTFLYRRLFHSSADGSSATAALICRLSTTAYGNFSVASVTLFFDNQRGETTFVQNDPDAHAFAELHYNGTGLIKAQWEVLEPSSSEFRILQQVNFHIAYGDRIVFRSPAVPPLPTVVSGVHQIRFRIVEPVYGFELPTITYYVVPQSGEKREIPGDLLKQVRPENDTEITPKTNFEWAGTAEGCKLLRFSVYEKSSVNLLLPITSSTSPDPKSDVASSLSLQSPNVVPVKGALIFLTELPPDAVRFVPKSEQWKRLRPGVKYLWQVQALAADGKVLTESELRIFQVKN